MILVLLCEKEDFCLISSLCKEILLTAAALSLAVMDYNDPV